MTADPTTAARTPHGLLRLGDATLALPLAQLLEVLPHPPSLMPLAIASPICAGAVEVRGSAIPVVDLSTRLGLGDGTTPRAIVAIVTFEGRVFGIAVDAAVGVVDIDPDDRRVLDGPPSALVTHAYRLPSNVDATRTVLLDVRAVVADPGTITTDDRLRSALAGVVGAAGHASTARGRRSLLLFRCGDRNLAIDTEGVHAVAPRVQPERSPIRWAACRGSARYLGKDVPLVDPLMMTLLGRVDDADIHDGIVLRSVDGDVILIATRVIDIAAVGPDALRDRPPVGLPDPAWLRGFVDVPDRGQFLLLDPDRLRTDEALARLCRLNVAPGAHAAQRDDAHSAVRAVASTDVSPVRPADELDDDGTRLAGRRYLCFGVGHDPTVEAAVLLEQVDEVLAVPPSMVPVDDGRGVVGLVEHRGHTLTLVCLAARLGMTPAPDPTGLVVLVVADGDRRAGLLVRALRTIATTVWEQATALPGHPRQLRFEPGAGLVRDVDLRAVWRDVVDGESELAALTHDLVGSTT